MQYTFYTGFFSSFCGIMLVLHRGNEGQHLYNIFVSESLTVV